MRRGDCCRCCEAAVERGEDIGHTPGPGACPHPRCDYHQGEAGEVDWAVLAVGLLLCWAVAFMAVTLWLALGGLEVGA